MNGTSARKRLGVLAVWGLLAASLPGASAMIALHDGIPWVYGRHSYGVAILHGPGSGEVAIPDELDGYPVTGIGEGAFYECNRLTGIAIPAGVTRIAPNAFFGCGNLREISIPEGLTCIESDVFAYCGGLKSVSIPGRVTAIEARAFRECNGLKSVSIPGSVRRIGNCAFLGCWNLPEVAIPYGVTSIGDYAFSGCGKLREVTVHDGVENLGEHAFANCRGLTNATIGNGVTNLGRGVFSGCGALKTVHASASWKSKCVDGTFWSEYAEIPEGCDIVYDGPEEPGEVTSSSPVPVPLRWLGEKAPGILALNGGDCEKAAVALAANGVNAVWECYVAGADPETDGGRFRVSVAATNGGVVATWGPESGMDGETPVNEGKSTDVPTRFFPKKEIPRPVFLRSGGETIPANVSPRFFPVKVEIQPDE